MTPSANDRESRAFVRWLLRQERHSRGLVRLWLRSLLDTLLPHLEQTGVGGVLASLPALIAESPVRSLLGRIYAHVLPNAAQQELERIGQRYGLPAQQQTLLQAGFFSRAWQRTTAQMLGGADTASRIRSITETTRLQIRHVLVEANAENLTVRQTATRLQSLLGGKTARNRALLIARTETTRAANAGHAAGAESSALALQKRWVATADPRTRDTHRAMLGKKPVAKDAFFVVGGVRMMYPGDPAGGAANVCRCRCRVLYEPLGTGLGARGGLSEDDPTPGYAPAESVTLAEAYARQHFADVVDYTGLSTERANTINRTLTKLRAKLGLPGGVLRQRFIDGRVGETGHLGTTFGPAEVDGPRMAFAKSFYATREKQQKQVEAFADEFKKRWAGKKGAPPRFSTLSDPKVDSLVMCISHEFAHALEFAYGRAAFDRSLSASYAKKRKLPLVDADKISEYAATDYDELYAEAMALFMSGHARKLPKPFRLAAQAQVDFIRQKHGSK